MRNDVVYCHALRCLVIDSYDSYIWPTSKGSLHQRRFHLAHTDFPTELGSGPVAVPHASIWVCNLYSETSSQAPCKRLL